MNNLLKTEGSKKLSGSSAAEKFLWTVIESEEIGNLPCSKCDGDCCGQVPFKFSELERIFKKYPKVPEFKARFKATQNISKKLLKIRRAFPDQQEKDFSVICEFQKGNSYLQNGINKDSCIFKRSEKVGDQHCMIYEDRPLICRAYGYKSCPCPYDGIPEQPKVPEIKTQLVKDCHLKRQNYMAQALIKKGFLNEEN